MSDGVAELAVFVKAAREEIMKQTGAQLLEFRNHGLRLRNRFVHRIQHSRSELLRMVLQWWFRNVINVANG